MITRLYYDDQLFVFIAFQFDPQVFLTGNDTIKNQRGRSLRNAVNGNVRIGWGGVQNEFPQAVCLLPVAPEINAGNCAREDQNKPSGEQPDVLLEPF